MVKNAQSSVAWRFDTEGEKRVVGYAGGHYSAGDMGKQEVRLMSRICDICEQRFVYKQLTQKAFVECLKNESADIKRGFFTKEKLWNFLMKNKV
jgi:hypothetical protein